MTDSKKIDLILMKLDHMDNEIKENRKLIGGVEKRLDEKIDCVESRLGARIDDVENRLGARIDDVENRLGARIDDVESRLGARIDDVENRLEERIDSVEGEVKGLKLIIENEIRENIKRIAEGHLDLSRHLHDVMNAKEEFEMLSVRVNLLETEVREINRKFYNKEYHACKIG